MEEEYIAETHFNYHNHTEYEYETLHENLQVLLYSVISFGLPFFLGHPQWLVGSLVNMMLVLGAQNLKGYKLLAMVFMPSLGVLTAGVLFGSLTKYLLFFMPMIWVGNIALVYGYKYLRHHFKNGVFNSISFAILAKVAILGADAYILTSFNVVPDVFMFTMGVFQLITAVIGAFLAMGITRYGLSRIAKSEN